MARTIRIQLDMESQAVQKMDSVMEQTNTATRKDFINTALAVFYWVVRERTKGYSIAAIDEENHRYRDLVLPALEEVAGTNAGRPDK